MPQSDWRVFTIQCTCCVLSWHSNWIIFDKIQSRVCLNQIFPLAEKEEVVKKQGTKGDCVESVFLSLSKRRWSDMNDLSEISAFIYRSNQELKWTTYFCIVLNWIQFHSKSLSKKIRLDCNCRACMALSIASLVDFFVAVDGVPWTDFWAFKWTCWHSTKACVTHKNSKNTRPTKFGRW